MKFVDKKTIAFDDICLVPRYSDLMSRSDATIELTSGYRNPIANSPMIHTSGTDMIRFMLGNNMMASVHRYFKSAEQQLAHVKKAVGSCFNEVTFAVGRCQEWIDTLYDAGVTRFGVDMAHGDSKICEDTIMYLKSKPNVTYIIAGNVATSEGYIRLIMAGATAVRVGIASGSICSTAKNTAFGVPMVTSLLECNEARGSVGGVMVADGGIRSAADILKAIACGADYVYCGKLLASTSLAEGPFFNKNKTDISTILLKDLPKEPTTIKYVEYAGMASHEMRMRNNSHKTKDISIEGVSGLINYTGHTPNIITNIEANLKAGLSYCGARNWVEFKDKVEIRMMSTSGIIEKETHLDG